MDRDAILKAIDDEEELEGDMPDEMYNALKKCFDDGDREAISASLRILVRMTKQGITDRVIAVMEAQ